MSRSLAQQSGLLNDYQNEKVALMGQLNAMKGVCISPLTKIEHITAIRMPTFQPLLCSPTCVTAIFPGYVLRFRF